MTEPKTDILPPPGAVNLLALAAKHPEQVRTLVAHEPPGLAATLRAVLDNA